jgi:hypothetical protein
MLKSTSVFRLLSQELPFDILIIDLGFARFPIEAILQELIDEKGVPDKKDIVIHIFFRVLARLLICIFLLTNRQ